MVIHVDYSGAPAPPQAPVIEGVLTGISVTSDGPSKVGPLEVCMPAGVGLTARHAVGLMCNIHLRELGLIGDSQTLNMAA